MATGNSETARNATLDMHFGADRHSTISLATLYFALFTGDPGGAGVEASGGGYARLAVANDGTTFPDPASGGQVSVGIVLQFATSSGLWVTSPAGGTVDHWGVFDNNTGGTLWYWGPLSASITVDGANITPRILTLLLTATES